MSELTGCNFCTLRDIAARAKRDGKVVVQRPDTDGGVYIHVLKKGDTLDTRPWDDGNRQIVSWMKEIPPSCCC